MARARIGRLGIALALLTVSACTCGGTRNSSRELAIDLPASATFRHAKLHADIERWSMGLGPEGGPDCKIALSLSLDDALLWLYRDYAKANWDVPKAVIGGEWKLQPLRDGRVLAISLDGGASWFAAYLDPSWKGVRYPFAVMHDPGTSPAALPDLNSAALQVLTPAESAIPNREAVRGALAFALGHLDDEKVLSTLAHFLVADAHRSDPPDTSDLEQQAIAAVAERNPAHPAVRAWLESAYRDASDDASKDSSQDAVLKRLEALLGTVPESLRPPSLDGRVFWRGDASATGTVEVWTADRQDSEFAASTPIEKDRFVFRKLAPGRYWVIARVAGASPQPRQVEVPRRRVDLELVPAATLSVDVFEGGAPIRGAVAIARPWTWQPVAIPDVTARCSPQGHCELAGLVHNAVHLEVTAPGRACAFLELFPAEANFDAVRIDFRDRPAFDGRLLEEASRNPISRARIRATPEGNQPVDACTTREVTTDADGRFRIEGLSPSIRSYRLSLVHSDGSTEELQSVRPGDNEPVYVSQIPIH